MNKHRITQTDTLANLPRPAAFIEVKHHILRANTDAELLLAEKMISRYIFDICEKPLREERKLDLDHILAHRKLQLEHASTHEDEALTNQHKKLSPQ